MKHFTLLILLLFSMQAFANKELKGKWYCHKITYKDGKTLEINHPLYANFISYDFKVDHVYVSNSTTSKGSRAKFLAQGPEMQIGFRMFTYSFSDKFLILEEKNGELKYFFLKQKDYFEMNKLYKEEYFLKGSDTIYKRNLSVNPEFTHEDSFTDFIRSSIYTSTMSSYKRHYFKGSFVLTKDNEIVDLKIENGVNKRFDRSFLEAVEESKKYWNNTTGKDVYIEKSYNFSPWGKQFIIKENKEFYKKLNEGNKEYKDLAFFAAIELYEEALALNFVENEALEPYVSELTKNLGICYLAVGNREKACESFTRVGSLHDFDFRNFILNFCEKKE